MPQQPLRPTPAHPKARRGRLAPGPARARRLLTACLGLLSCLVPALAHGPKAPGPAKSPAAAHVKPSASHRRAQKSHDLNPGWPGQGEPAVEKVRRHLLAREAGGNYAAVDRLGRCFGGYQFQRGTSNRAAHRMQRPDLVGVTANLWTREDQDAAFYVIYDRGRGRQHWAHGTR